MSILVACLLCGAAQAQPLIIKLSIDGDINPATVSYISRGLQVARERNASLLLVQLDTPGGQLTSTRQITGDMLHSPVPVGVWVGPEGARAASAGTFIAYAAHVSGMAPSTHLGAAHPVLFGGVPGQPGDQSSEQLKTLEDKAVNDAVAYIKGLAERRGRNAEWAERAVRESETATATEAVELNVADFVAATDEEFAEKADGREVALATGQVTLSTAGATIETLDVSWRERLLSVVANPNVAYLLLVIGFYGIIFELKAPGMGGAGVVGIICLILGLYGLSVLPVNWAGLALILAGIALLVAELYTPTYGILGTGGVVALVVGSLILVQSPAPPVSRPLIAGVAVGTAAFFLFALGAIVHGQRRPVAIGSGALTGKTAEVRRRLDPDGTVHVDGALWAATTDQPPLEEGQEVVVVEELEHMRLKVRGTAGNAR
ncbi:MAG: nodulation protein NfeD [Armatimonadota bacterium]|nr:nodulation protein NfeD [Armatimonadota bacterium]